MKYRDLYVRTQREFPNNARTEGFGWLVRAGYVTRENETLPPGKKALARLQELSSNPSFIPLLGLPNLASGNEIFFQISTGAIKVVHCPACNYSARLELARFTKPASAAEDPRPLEKVLTPDCHTIESLAKFLNIPKEKTAKAIMFTRVSDGKFVFVIIRGDMTLSDAKLRNAIGEVKPATLEEIEKSGAAAGYASPVGLAKALIIVDDLIPRSFNLAAGANETGYHLLNVNCGRDYQAEIIEDVVQANEGDACDHCGHPLIILACDVLATHNVFFFENILLALAETYHDEKGLNFPACVAPFDVYLMHIPGKELDTRVKAVEIYNELQCTGISVLFDDRDKRAGVKFNDADLIGCPIRVAIGERGLKEEMTEVKVRKTGVSVNVKLEELANQIKNMLLS